MSIGFVVGSMMLCFICGFRKLGMMFAAAFWLGITIAHPGLIFLWLGLFILYMIGKYD